MESWPDFLGHESFEGEWVDADYKKKSEDDDELWSLMAPPPGSKRPHRPESLYSGQAPAKFQKGPLSRCSSSRFHEFCSPDRSYSNGDIHPFPASPVHSLHSSDPSNEDLSPSSEVVGSMDGFTELNSLMESILYQSFPDQPVEESDVAAEFSGEVKKEGKHIPAPLMPEFEASCDADFNGIRLVHLLIASAEAVASRDVDLASVILARLKELACRTANTMQRVASYFADGLRCRLEGGRASPAAKEAIQRDTLAAFQILHEVSPYIKFSHFTANQAILEAMEGDNRVHIVDYDIMEGIQWPSLMQALATRKGGPPQLRITALYRSHSKRGLSTVQETGKRLTEFAASLNLPFLFNQARVDNDEEFRPSAVKAMKGETLAVNCILHLPHMQQRTSTSVASFLHGIRKLCPSVVTLVEDELGFTTSAFTAHFFEALHHYSAIFDSLEAALSTQTIARSLVEHTFLAPRITSTVTFCGSSKLLQEGAAADQGFITQAHAGKQTWSSLVKSAGLKALPFSFHNVCQARLLLGLFRDGYKLEEDNNRLLLGWRCKPLFAASVWSYE